MAILRQFFAHCYLLHLSGVEQILSALCPGPGICAPACSQRWTREKPPPIHTCPWSVLVRLSTNDGLTDGANQGLQHIFLGWRRRSATAQAGGLVHLMIFHRENASLHLNALNASRGGVCLLSKQGSQKTNGVFSPDVLTSRTVKIMAAGTASQYCRVATMFDRNAIAAPLLLVQQVQSAVGS
jgi:hypothetical protein